MKYRRKLENRTNYRKRLRLLVTDKPRLVIRKFLRHVSAQIIKFYYDGDKTIVSAHSRELLKYGYKSPRRNLPTAYLVGLLIAKKAKEKAIIDVIPDIGFYPPVKGSLIFSLIKGAKDGGLDITFDEEAIPDKRRIEGWHIVEYSEKNKERFTGYQINPSELPNNFNETKNKLLGK